MGLLQTTAPTAEPVTLEECKTFLRLPCDQFADDPDITSMIEDARGLVELYLRRQLMRATFTLTMDRFPYLTTLDPMNQANPKFDNSNYYYGSPDRFAIWIPRPPLLSVTSINYVNTVGSSTLLSASSYNVDASRLEPGRIMPVYGAFWPGTLIQPNAVSIIFQAGYSADDSESIQRKAVPGIIKRAIKILVSRIYNGIGGVSIPEEIKWMLMPHRNLDERVLEYA